MADKTKIDWCDASWNPVTGCLHGCEYCYARRMVNRFGGLTPDENPHILNRMCIDAMGKKDIYPFGFAPTFHRYRLDWPAKLQRPRTIFVCSMADLFGEWVPDEWIREVVRACEAAPQHRYLFLTKNPGRIWHLINKGIWLPNTIDWRFGYSIDGKWRISSESPVGIRSFCSVEPLLQKPDPEMLNRIAMTAWCIIGAETGNRKGKVIPEKDWIDMIVSRCREVETPVFMKESLREIMGDDFVQEFPWEADSYGK